MKSIPVWVETRKYRLGTHFTALELGAMYCRRSGRITKVVNFVDSVSNIKLLREI